MSWQFASALVILAAPVLIGGYDLIAFWTAGNRATISRISLEAAKQHPAYLWSVCYLFGLLCGHLFAPSGDDRQLPGWLAVCLFLVVPILVAFGSLITGVKTAPQMMSAAQEGTRDYPLITVMLFLVIGAAIGSTFLPQSRDD